MATQAQVTALYQKKIRELGAQVRADRRLVDPDITVTKRSRVCGSSVTLDFRFRGKRIEAIGYRTRACSLVMAATAILVRIGAGHDAEDIGQAKIALADLLMGKRDMMPADWQTLDVFAAAIPFPARHSSILLPFEAAAASFRSLVNDSS